MQIPTLIKFTVDGLYYDSQENFENSGNLKKFIDKNFYSHKFNGWNGYRDIYSFYLDSLQPDTQYMFFVSINHLNYTKCQDNTFKFRFKTLPGPNKLTKYDKKIVFAGNAGVTDIFYKQITQLKSDAKNIGLVALG